MEEEMLVSLQKKYAYGNVHLLPANETAINFAALLRRKTILPHDFEFLKRLGYKIMVDGNYM